MAGSFVNDFEQKLLQRMFTAGADPIAADLWLSLVITSAPTEATVDPSVNEASYTSYARVDITGSTPVTAWTVATQGTGFRATNDSDIDFPQAGSGPQTMLGALVSDVASGNGNIIWYDDAISVVIANNDIPTVPAGQAQFDIDV